MLSITFSLILHCQHKIFNIKYIKVQSANISHLKKKYAKMFANNSIFMIIQTSLKSAPDTIRLGFSLAIKTRISGFSIYYILYRLLLPLFVNQTICAHGKTPGTKGVLGKTPGLKVTYVWLVSPSVVRHSFIWKLKVITNFGKILLFQKTSKYGYTHSEALHP